MSKELNLETIEPLRSYNFRILLGEIPPQLFNGYKIYNDGEKVIFETEFYETVNYICDIFELFNMEKISIEYLDYTEKKTVKKIDYVIKGLNFINESHYGDDKIKSIKLKLIVTKN